MSYGLAPLKNDALTYRDIQAVNAGRNTLYNIFIRVLLAAAAVGLVVVEVVGLVGGRRPAELLGEKPETGPEP